MKAKILAMTVISTFALSSFADEPKCSLSFKSTEPPKQIEIPKICNNFSITIENSDDKKKVDFIISTAREHGKLNMMFMTAQLKDLRSVDIYVRYEIKKNNNYIGITDLVNKKMSNIQFEVDKIKSGDYVLYPVVQIETPNKQPLLMTSRDSIKLIVK